MNPDDIIARQVEQLDKEKREQQIRLKTQEKKVKQVAFIILFILYYIISFVTVNNIIPRY